MRLAAASGVPEHELLPMDIGVHWKLLTDARSLELLRGETVLVTLDPDGVRDREPSFGPKPLTERADACFRLADVADSNPYPLDDQTLANPGLRRQTGSEAVVQVDNLTLVPPPGTRALAGRAVQPCSPAADGGDAAEPSPPRAGARDAISFASKHRQWERAGGRES